MGLGGMICYDAALQRLRWMLPPGDPRAPGLALAVEAAAAHRALADRHPESGPVAAIAAEADHLARRLLAEAGLHCDLPMLLLAAPLPG